tara:strand:- start:93 stop:593 length:501 start_codon:yes stop_codon:yes gene_type:complete
MRKIIVIIAALGMISLPALSQTLSADETAVIAVLNDFHDAAAKADPQRYLGHLTDNAVFLGTDEKERFPLVPDFTDYVNRGFAAGGWDYYSINKNISFSREGSVAWFDETSISNGNGGHFRGSGVLEKIDGEWKIAQYVLSFLVYNELWEEVLELNANERTNQLQD